jgi:hypothetical protein
MTSTSKFPKRVQSATVGIFLIVLSSCSVGNRDSDTLTPTTSTAASIVVTGEPVTDFNAIFEARSAIDHSFISVDTDGIYGVIVTKRFDFMQYMATGWKSITPTMQEMSSDGTAQVIDGVPVEKAMDVTTRDYTGDRESDFLIRFGSSFSKYGAIANSKNGIVEFKPFCLSNPSDDRPGVIRVFAVENLTYSDQYKILEGDDVGSDGYHVKDYWRWSKKHSCFKTTSSF